MQHTVSCIRLCQHILKLKETDAETQIKGYRRISKIEKMKVTCTYLGSQLFDSDKGSRKLRLV